MPHKPTPPRSLTQNTAAAGKAAKGDSPSATAFTATSRKTQARKRRYAREPGGESYAVADGRVTVGCVVPVGATRWRAIDREGRGLGIFKTLKQAIRALPSPKAVRP